jgi:hypothetical protein
LRQPHRPPLLLGAPLIQIKEKIVPIIDHSLTDRTARGWPHLLSLKPICDRTPDELRQQAEQFRQMAATARTADVQETLLELADRYEGLADQRAVCDLT